MELIRLLHSPTKVPRLPSSRGLSTGMLTFIYRLPSVEAYPRFPGGYAFIYRLSSPEAIHGFQVAMLLYTVCPRPRLSTVGYAFIYRLPSPEAIHGFYLNPPLPSLRRHMSTA